VLFDRVEYAGHNQLLNVPGYAELTRPSVLEAVLRASPTHWLFSWGLGETDIYRADAEARLTASVIDQIPGVEVVIHNGGHEFPLDAVSGFVHARLVP
jgi:hypothetical protein